MKPTSSLETEVASRSTTEEKNIKRRSLHLNFKFLIYFLRTIQSTTTLGQLRIDPRRERMHARIVFPLPVRLCAIVALKEPSVPGDDANGHLAQHLCRRTLGETRAAFRAP